MSRISIDVTTEEHEKLKALAALRGKSIKDYVIERTLGADDGSIQNSALRELESLLDARIRSAQQGGITRKSVGDIFHDFNLGRRTGKRLRSTP